MSAASHPANSTEREPRGGDPSIRQFVGFRLDDADYAIPITSIREIILMKPITRLPQVSDAIEGLINLRGNVMPLVNLRKQFGLVPRPFDDETRTIVVTVHDKILGCIVDEVTRVVRIGADQVQPLPISMARSSRRYISGLAKLDDRLLIILDIEKLFDSEELEIDGGALVGEPASLPVTNPTESGA